MNQRQHISIAVLVDVDGTLAGPYKTGTRALRSSAHEALSLLTQHATVFLWSIAGAENGQRLLEEYPELRSLIAGNYGKEDFPLHLIERPIAIDDEGIDDVVLQCEHIILGETYEGEADTGSLLEAARIVVEAIQQQDRTGNDYPQGRLKD